MNCCRISTTFSPSSAGGCQSSWRKSPRTHPYALADLLHKTRGSASSLGILHIPDAMRALEPEVRSGAAWDSVESTLRTLHSQLNEALGEFRSYIEAQDGR